MLIQRAFTTNNNINLREFIHYAVHSDAYHEARRKAQYHYSERAKFFEAAEEASRRGNGVEANSLANEVRWHGDLMHNFNALTVDEVMRDQTGDTIDLHGLFASEAIDVVKITMDEAKPGHNLDFITGKGLNSDKLKGPVLLPTIEQLCINQNWSFKYNEGCFSITVPLEAPPISEHQRLAVGDFIPKEIWKCLRDIEGKVFDASYLLKCRKEPAAISINHYAEVFIDPRRSSAQTMEVINEFKGIHCDALGPSNKISLNIITSDDTNDLRKLVTVI